MSITANPINQNGALITGKGTKTFLNVSANTLVKATSGRIAKISVNTAGSAPSTVHDAATIVGASASNQIASIPATLGVYDIDFPVSNGIVIKIGSGQVLAVSYI